MCKLKIFTSSVLLVTTPTVLAFPQDTLPYVSSSVNNQTQLNAQKWTQPTTYNEIMSMLEDLESGELEKKCSLSQLQQLKEYLAILAKEGILPDEPGEEIAFAEDVEDLMNGEDSLLAYSFGTNSEYMFIPAIFNGYSNYDIIRCGKISKAWKKTKKFVKRHKKKIIIGAAIVVAATVVVVAVAAASSIAAGAAATGAAGAGATTRNKSNKKNQGKNTPSDSGSVDISPKGAALQETPILKSTIDNQISSFKENIVQNQFFQSTTEQSLSLEENGRILGSLFAHESFNHFNNQLSNYPQFSQEMQTIASQYNFSMPPGASDNPVGFAHNEIDKRFASDYGLIFSNPAQEVNFNALSYQARGEAASFYGYHNQAIHDFSKAIEMNPKDPTLYLQRGISHFNTEQYESSIADFRSYAAQSEPIPQKEQFNLSEFTIGFIEGLPQGICKGGKDILFFAYDGITHPIHTAKELFNACSVLATYVQTNEWEAIGKTLSPELHKVVTEWGYIPSRELGNLISSSIGEFGSQALVPMAGGKLIVKGINGAKEVTYVLKTIGRAEEMILLEAAAEVGNGAKFGEILNAGRNTLFLGEELGFTAKEMVHLKQAGKLETTVTRNYEHLSLPMKESIALFKEAQTALKPYAKKPLPELMVRELIHETGIPTFPRPPGIPENYLVMVADRSAGMEYVHPTNTHIRVRVMPGKPHSPNPGQQKPYVIQQKNGKAFDKHGNLIKPEDLKAHIPLKEFIYRE